MASELIVRRTWRAEGWHAHKRKEGRKDMLCDKEARTHFPENTSAHWRERQIERARERESDWAREWKGASYCTSSTRSELKLLSARQCVNGGGDAHTERHRKLNGFGFCEWSGNIPIHKVMPASCCAAASLHFTPETWMTSTATSAPACWLPRTSQSGSLKQLMMLCVETCARKALVAPVEIPAAPRRASYDQGRWGGCGSLWSTLRFLVMWTHSGLELLEHTEVNNPSDLRGHVSHVPLQRRAVIVR